MQEAINWLLSYIYWFSSWDIENRKNPNLMKENMLEINE